MSGSLILATIFIFSSSLAPSLGAVPGNTGPSFVGDVCTKILVTRTGEYANTMCREALERALTARLARDEAVKQSERCTRAGLQEGTAAFSMCVMAKSKSDLAAVPAGQTVSLPVEDPTLATAIPM